MKRIIALTLLITTLTGCTMTGETGTEQNGTQTGDLGEKLADSQINSPVNSSINSTVEADVRTTVADVTLWLGNHVGAETVPTTGPDIVTPTETDSATTVYIQGGFYDFTVTGYNTQTNYQYKYDSTTGQYTSEQK